jgi:hypothetical protein
MHFDDLRRCLALTALLLAAPSAVAFQDGATTRVSVMTGCGKAPIGLGNSIEPAISEDGRVVMFASTSTMLVPGDTTVAWFANLDGRGGFGPLQLITQELNKPMAIDAALINADDRPDVLTASFWDDRLAWYYNDLPASGNFIGPQDISLAMDDTTTVATADLDGDGDVDVLGTDIEDGLNRAVWFANDGLGNLGGPAPITLYAGGTTSVFPADLDGDGDVDVAFGVPNEGLIRWQENTTGLGHFTSEHVVTIKAKAANTLQAADFDGDGDLDVVTSVVEPPLGPKISWFRNEDGLGTFGAETLVTNLGNPVAVDAGDLDGDGDADLVAGTASDGLVAWFPNLDGAGNFGSPIMLATDFFQPSSVAAADLDGDGDIDVVSTSWNQGELAWYENTGAGTFAAKAVISSAVFGAGRVRATDLDGDADLDLLVARTISNEVCWFRNLDGAASFGPKLLVTGAILNVLGVHAADIDADGDRDVVTASGSDDTIAWFPNLDGQGSFGPIQVVSAVAAGAQSAFAHDLDSDGDVDVMSVSVLDGRITWYENADGVGGSFVTRDLLDSITQNGRDVMAADMDGDGDPDVLAAGGSAGNVTWFENPDGLASFGVEHKVADGIEAPYSISGGDLDGDGDVDMLSATVDDDRIAWYRNTDGLGSFGPQLVISSSAVYPRSVRAADLDGDGDLDVLAASYLDDTVAWHENLDGAGSFGPEQVVTSTADGARLAIAADVDGDRDLDVVVTSFLDDVTAWYENEDGRGGAFAPHIVHDGPTVGATAVQVSDVDVDGDLDLLLASAYPNPTGVEIYAHDRYLLETTWISKTLDGTPSNSGHPKLSADGRFIAFEAGFANLVPEPDLNIQATDIYVHDRLSGETTRVDVSSAGVQANNVCLTPSLSGDGRYVAFMSFADNLVAGDPTCCSTVDAFLHDRLTGETELIGRLPGGGWPTQGTSDPDLSSDGQHVAFVGGAGYLPEDTNGFVDVFDLHIPTGVIERVSLGTGGIQIENGHSVHPSISADGRFVAFETNAVVDPADTNIWTDVYVHDRLTQVTHLASISLAGTGSNEKCTEPRISGNGRYVVFMSRATNLVDGTTQSLRRVFRRDLQAGITTLMGVASDGTPANAEILSAELSGDGHLAVFDSKADNLVPSDTDNVADVFVHDVEPWFPIGCDLPGEGGAPLLAGSGPLLADSEGKLTLQAGAPSSPAVIFAALESQPIPFKGGVLTAFPPVLQALIVLDAAGGFSLGFRWPAAAPPGTEIYLHVAVVDPTTVEGVALSSALRARSP